MKYLKKKIKKISIFIIKFKFLNQRFKTQVRVCLSDVLVLGLDPNDMNEAILGCAELYRLMLMDYLHLAIAYFRGYKEIFGNSDKTC